MNDLIAQAAAADFESRAVMPARELGAYEALWAREGTSFKTLADTFRQHPGSIPSDFVSQREAEQYYERYAVAEADHDAVEFHMKLKKEFAQSHDPHVFDRYRQRFAGGVGTYPLVGTPERIVAEMVAMQRIGFAGTTVSFVNFRDELPFFIDRVLPLMEEAGLRAPAAAAA